MAKYLTSSSLALLVASLATLLPACSPDTMPSSSSSCACGPEAACIDAVCVDIGLSDIERGCNPLSSGECMYPWPSNVFTSPDEATVTGLRLAYDDTVVPRNASDEPFPVADYNSRFDGFSPNSQIRFLFPAGVDPKNLPPIDDVDQSLTENSPTILLRADTGEKWIHFAEIDARAPSADRQAVFVRPMKRLDFGARYVVAVRDLVDPTGKPIEPSPAFRALRDKLPTDVPQIEALRPQYETMFAALEKAGVPRQSLQLAWDFTTASNEVLTRDVRHILPDLKMRAAAGNLGFTLTDVRVDPPELPNLKIAAKGTFKVPSYLTGDGGPGEVFARDAAGLPQFQKLVDADMYIAIPRDAWDAGVPAKVYVYGHGLLGSGEEAFYVANDAQTYIAIGIDFWGMSYRDIDVLGGTIFPHNMKSGHTVPERLLQSAVNFATAGYLAQGDLGNAPELQKDGQNIIDTSEVFYLGGSQGGIIGGTVMAMAPQIEHGGLVVGGGVYSLMVWRNTSWPDIEGIWNIYHRDSVERELLFAMFQSQYDLAEPGTYADHLWRDPFPGNPQKRILLVEAYNDSQVSNIATEMMARTYGIPMSAPGIYDVPGVPNETMPIDGSALLQVDTKNNDPLPPKQNLAPMENGAHGSSVDSPTVKKIIKEFLVTGVVTHHCSGTCDPE